MARRAATVDTVELTGTGVDEFGELPALKRDAVARSAKRGHLITEWHRRGLHDPYGREAFCDRCGAACVVSTEPALGRPTTYGWTLTRTCGKAARS